MFNMIFNKLFGSPPPKIPNGTVLEYWDGPFAALCVDVNNISHSWMCYMNKHFPIDRAAKVKVFNRFTIFDEEKFVVKYAGGEMTVRLIAKNGDYPINDDDI